MTRIVAFRSDHA